MSYRKHLMTSDEPPSKLYKAVELGTNLAEVGTDCISRQALLDKFEPWLKVNDYNDGELNMLKAVLYEIRFMRPVQPEIIRCKDCKHFKQVFAPNSNDGLCGHWHSKCDARTNRNGYCSHAERKEVTE